MAARKTAPKVDETQDVEATEVESASEAPTEDGEPTEEVEVESSDGELEDEPQTADVTDEASEVEDAPPGYMWVQRRKSVQLGVVNPQWGEPQLIDVKSFAELEPQGWRAAK